MSMRPRITEEQIAFARTVILKRRELLRQLKLVPTNAELAQQLGCSPRWIHEISVGRAYKVPRETSLPVNFTAGKQMDEPHFTSPEVNNK